MTGASGRAASFDDFARFAADEASIWNDNIYYERAEPHTDDFWASIQPMIEHFDFRVTVDLACGHGRSTRKLAELADVTYAMDVNEENVEFCRSRFADRPGVVPVRNNGISFQPLPPASVTAIFCGDSMVHFDSDIIRTYLGDAGRILRPGGLGFFHHSNFSAAPGRSFHANPHARNFMSRELFAHYTVKAGLEVVAQEVRTWGDDKDLDCFSVVRNPAAAS